MPATIHVSGTPEEIVEFARTLQRGLEADKDRIHSDIRAFLSKGNKVEAIKLRRAQTGCTLKEAKEWVDSLPPIIE